jgi:hypothetical protein
MESSAYANHYRPTQQSQQFRLPGPKLSDLIAAEFHPDVSLALVFYHCDIRRHSVAMGSRPGTAAAAARSTIDYLP